jgi:hypothetical protein
MNKPLADQLRDAADAIDRVSTILDKSAKRLPPSMRHALDRFDQISKDTADELRGIAERVAAEE